MQTPAIQFDSDESHAKVLNGALDALSEAYNTTLGQHRTELTEAGFERLVMALEGGWTYVETYVRERFNEGER